VQNVEMIPSHGITVYLINTYRQPFKTGFELVIIPLIRSGEEYRLTVKINKLSKDIFNVSRLIIHYYSLNGSLYNIEYLINIQETTLTVTETDTRIITQTTTDTLTQTKIVTSNLTILTRYITATSTKQATDNFWFITLITIILAICLALAVIYLYKIKVTLLD
jgi:carbohydrate-binding DOMON domain-containing protein